MILTKQKLDRLREEDYICSKLTDAQAQELLYILGREPYPELPFVWDEETIWHTIRKMTRL